jgi:hypothetical protein
MTTELSPLAGEEEYAELLAEMVAETAPRVFAVVEEYGERVDARVVGWGLAHPGHADVIGLNGVVLLGVAGPEKVLGRFARRERVTARIVWPHDAHDLE